MLSERVSWSRLLQREPMAGPISGCPLQTEETSHAILIGASDRGQRGEAGGVVAAWARKLLSLIIVVLPCAATPSPMRKGYLRDLTMVGHTVRERGGFSGFPVSVSPF